MKTKKSHATMPWAWFRVRKSTSLWSAKIQIKRDQRGAMGHGDLDSSDGRARGGLSQAAVSNQGKISGNTQAKAESTTTDHCEPKRFRPAQVDNAKAWLLLLADARGGIPDSLI